MQFGRMTLERPYQISDMIRKKYFQPQDRNSLGMWPSDDASGLPRNLLDLFTGSALSECHSSFVMALIGYTKNLISSIFVLKHITTHHNKKQAIQTAYLLAAE